jgi:hypothetical protein
MGGITPPGTARHDGFHVTTYVINILLGYATSSSDILLFANTPTPSGHVITAHLELEILLEMVVVTPRGTWTRYHARGRQPLLLLSQLNLH